MDELDRTLAELRRTVVEGGMRVIAQRRPREPALPDDLARAGRDPAREPVTPYDDARAGRTGAGQPVRHGRSGAPHAAMADRGGDSARKHGTPGVQREGTDGPGVWPRLRLPVLLILTSILTALLLL